MIRSSKSTCEWQTVLIGLLVAPVFVLTAELFQLSQHDSNSIHPVQFPHYILFHQQKQQQRQQHANNNAKNLETLNSRKMLSRNDDMMHINAMLNAAEKPVDTSIHRIARSKQKPVPSAINSALFDAKNRDAFLADDGNEMRLQGQPGNVLSRKFIHRLATWFKSDPSATATTTTMYNGNVANPTSFAERFMNNLAANNVAVNFSQSYSPTLFLPFDPEGTQYSLDDFIIHDDDSTSETKSEKRNISPGEPHIIFINHGPTRIYGAGSESKFPPLIEFFVQRIQKYFSVYKYEDLSRPALPSQIPFDVNSGTSPEMNVIEATVGTTVKPNESTGTS